MSQITHLIPQSGPGSGDVSFLAGNSGGDVGPTAGGVINVIGDGVTIDVVGNPGTNTLTISAIGEASEVTSITGNSGPAQVGALNLITANATPKFVGAAGTITLDFNLSNLFLGAPGNITSGVENTAYGQIAGANITSGSSNTAIGFEAMVNSTTGGGNTSIGAFSLFNVLSGANNNCALGFGALETIVTGSNNIGIGLNGGASLTLANSNNIMIGNTGSAGLNGVIKIGTNGTHTATYIAGIDTVNVGSVAKVVTMASDQLGTATITAGTNISVTPTANTITIATTGGASLGWSVITANQTAAVNNGYFCNKAGTLALALPAVSAVGDVIEVANINTALGVQFTQAAGQQIFFSTLSTTSGATGTLTSSAVGDSLKMVCRTANLTWWVVSSIGNWTPA